ncbi:PRP38 family-domain-containing protein [Mycotypha africana]|uniref:PRP38 family-domain-containing protein n=1 Tax=Mycotypha africana TaxID=64632 RepID=UPI002300A99D|nr:PRP38 family-domain-containing protein [Mycotypha africana]KAI8973830.1 PRP38 family-domain-containing protein [Mycotypha africana]
MSVHFENAHHPYYLLTTIRNTKLYSTMLSLLNLINNATTYYNSLSSMTAQQKDCARIFFSRQFCASNIEMAENPNYHSGPSVHGRHPMHLIEKIIRERIQGSLYWKEKCYGLSAATLMDRAVELEYIGGLYGGNQPTEFLCLTLKLLQLLPEKDVIIELISQEDFKYLRALGAFYLRLTGRAKDIYQYLEPLLNDYRKLRVREGDGYFLTYMDAFIDDLLHKERVCDVMLPYLTNRYVLEQNDELEPRESALEDDLEDEESQDEEKN